MKAYFVFRSHSEICAVRQVLTGTNIFVGNFDNGMIYSQDEGIFIYRLSSNHSVNWFKYMKGIHFSIRSSNDISTFNFYPKKKFCFSHLICSNKNDIYEVHKYLGYKISVYKNGQQIAYFDKCDISGRTDFNQIYKMVFDSDVDLSILIGILFSLTSNWGIEMGRSIVYNLNLQFGKKFDQKWLPK